MRDAPRESAAAWHGKGQPGRGVDLDGRVAPFRAKRESARPQFELPGVIHCDSPVGVDRDARLSTRGSAKGCRRRLVAGGVGEISRRSRTSLRRRARGRNERGVTSSAVARVAQGGRARSDPPAGPASAQGPRLLGLIFPRGDFLCGTRRCAESSDVPSVRAPAGSLVARPPRRPTPAPTRLAGSSRRADTIPDRKKG